MKFPIRTLLLAVLASLAGITWAQGGPPMAPPISAAPAVQRKLPLFDEFSARLEAVETVELRSRVAGTVMKVHFRDGQDVKRGELLFSIDARPFAAELARAQAQLAAAQNAEALSASELLRSRKLLEQKAVAQQEADQAEATARSAQAAVRVAQAALASAQLNVEYAQIRAPIAGRVSRAAVTTGNLVGVGEPVLTTVVAQDKVHAWFDMSEQAYLRARPRLMVKDGVKNGAKAGAGPGSMVSLGLANEAGFPHSGTVDFIDNRLNAATGSIRVRAVFDNRAGLFLPGLFARLRLSASAAQDVVLTPERAIGTDQSKRFVYVVGADKLAQFREVKLGPLVNGLRIIESGLKAGELVVVNGLQRVRPGAPVAAQVLAVDEHGMPVELAVLAPGAPPGPPSAPASAPASAAKKP